MFAKAKEFLLSHLIGLSVTAVATLLVIVAREILHAALPTIASKLPQQTLLELLLLSLILCCILLVFLWLSLHTHRLKLQNGFYWDKRGNPYCVACQKPLTDYAKWASLGNEWNARCTACNVVYAFLDASGNPTDKTGARRN
jgi:hypothetical protein